MFFFPSFFFPVFAFPFLPPTFLYFPLQRAILSDMFTGRLRSEIPPILSALSDALVDITSLEEIDLSDNAFGPSGAEPLVPLLSKNTNISTIRLNNNGLGIQGGNFIALALLAAAEKNKKEGKPSRLRTLIAGRNRLENGSMGKLAEALEAHGDLVHLGLPQNGIRPEGIALLLNSLSKCKNLKHLDLQDNTFTVVGSNALALALPKWPFIESLNIGDCLLSAAGGSAIAKALACSTSQHIHTLMLTYGEIDEAGAHLFAEAFEHMKELKRLEMNGNAFSAEGKGAENIRNVLRLTGCEDALDVLDDMDIESEEERSEEEEEEEEEEKEKEIAKEEKDDEIDNLAKAMAQTHMT